MLYMTASLQLLSANEEQKAQSHDLRAPSTGADVH